MRTLKAIFIVTFLLAFAATAVLAEEEPVDQLPYKYVGNMDTEKFHRPSCPYAKIMNRVRKRFFHFRHEATDLGQVPCRYCLPPIVRNVRGTIRPSQSDPNQSPNQSPNQEPGEKLNQVTQDEMIRPDETVRPDQASGSSDIVKPSPLSSS